MYNIIEVLLKFITQIIKTYVKYSIQTSDAGLFLSIFFSITKTSVLDIQCIHVLYCAAAVMISMYPVSLG
jgi:hypothetical protein